MSVVWVSQDLRIILPLYVLFKTFLGLVNISAYIRKYCIIMEMDDIACGSAHFFGS